MRDVCFSCRLRVEIVVEIVLNLMIMEFELTIGLGEVG